VEFEWKIPKWSNAIKRDRAGTYFQAYAAATLYFAGQALEELHTGRTRTWSDFKIPDDSRRFPGGAGQLQHALDSVAVQIHGQQHDGTGMERGCGADAALSSELPIRCSRRDREPESVRRNSNR